MTQTPSNTRRFVRAAWALLSFQFIASAGAAAVTAWAAFAVRDLEADVESGAAEPPAQEARVEQDAPAPTDFAENESESDEAPAPDIVPDPVNGEVAPENPAVAPVNDGPASIAIRRQFLNDLISILISRESSTTFTAVLGPDPDGAGAPPAFQWLRDGEPIPGAVSETYRTSADDAGRGISVRADYVDGEGNQESVISGSEQIPAAETPAPPAPPPPPDFE
jgi:hypothetical protein